MATSGKRRQEPVAPTAFRFGKLPPIIDSRTLRLSDYLEPTLPPPPPSKNYAKNVKKWPMFGNNALNDCTCAAAGHMIEAWTASAGRLVVPTESAVLALYKRFDPSGTKGCNMLSILKYWRNVGLGSDKITAFAALEHGNVTEVMDAVNIFGGAYIGLVMPKFAVNTNLNLSTIPWVVPTGGPVGNAAFSPHGHCVNVVAYDVRNLYVVTWGAIKSMSWEFYRVYSDEAFAVVSDDFLKGEKAPSGFNMRQLIADLAEIEKVSARRASVVGGVAADPGTSE